MADEGRSKFKRIPRWVVTVLALAAVAGVFVATGRHVGRVLNVASAFYAKTLCSGVFVSRRSEADVVREDVLADMVDWYSRFRAVLDRDHGLVTVSLFGLAERQALHRPGLGCTLVNGTTVEALLKQAHGFLPAVLPPPLNEQWPAGELVDAASGAGGFDRALLDAALDEAFSEPREQAPRRTRAVVVAHKGRIVAERYAPGITASTPLLGWSVAKGVTGALTGILVGEGKLSLEQKDLFEAWREDKGPRAGITVDHLMRMTAGLDFDVPHARMLSDVRKMLFVKHDAARYAMNKPSAAEPGSLWFYASGDTILLNRLHRQAVGGGHARYFAFPRAALFNRIGMTTAVLEPDPSGTFLGPAFMYASARDWARLGLLFANDGVWLGERILPEGWVDYMTRPTPQSGNLFAAHLWRSVPPFLSPEYADNWPLPEDRFLMLGHDGQMIAVMPSQKLVVVRLGLSRRRGSWDHDAFLYHLLKAFPKE